MAYVKLKKSRIQGEIQLQGSKNAVLPILAASLLCRGEVILHHCPDILDVYEMLTVLKGFSVSARFEQGDLIINAKEAKGCFERQVLTNKTRAGLLFLGSSLSRFQEASLMYPGGCVIGKRPINYHCNLIRAMKVALIEEADGIYAKGKPMGADITLPYPSVGATENAILAAACAKGTTVIKVAAREPEITELCHFLQSAGAKISGVSTDVLTITGVPYLHGTEFTLCGDRIAAGTYLAAAMISGGEITIHRAEGIGMEEIFSALRNTGLQISVTKDTISAVSGKEILPIQKLETAPYPRFPTDMQSQMISLLSVAKGQSEIVENVFESRFAVIPELIRMGAKLTETNSGVIVHGESRLIGTSVFAKDLRGGAALLIAALAAEGETKVYGYEYIARGYENICNNLQQLGILAELHEEE